MIGNVLAPLVVIAVLVAVNGVFVAAEFALVGARSSRLEVLATSGNRSARRLLTLFDETTGKDGYIAVAQLGITFASIGLGMYGEPAVASWLYGPFETAGLSEAAAHTVGFVIALSGITYLHVVLGEMIPKALALQAPERVSVRLDPLMRLFSLVFRPMVLTLNWLALALMRLLGIREPDKHLSLYTSAELAIVTDEAADSGQLGEMQRDLIRNVFELAARTADELMTPRSRLEVIDVGMTPESVLELVSSSPLSRYPVVDGSLDHVRGVVHVKDVIRAHERGRSIEPAVLARPAPTIAASALADQVLALFRTQRVHAAIVVDDAGATLGLVTMDDLIADVMDAELQRVDAEPVANDDGSITVDGATTLTELADDHRIVISQENATTVAEAFLSAAGAHPVEGDVVSIDGYDLVLEERSARRLTRIRVVPRPAPNGR